MKILESAHMLVTRVLQITAHGGVNTTVRVIAQLIFAANERESIYIVTQMRGSWFPAFAGRLFGMSVELRLNDNIACAGTNGTAIFPTKTLPEA